MADILGLGLTHAPTLTRVPDEMTQSLRRTLGGKNLPPHLKDPEELAGKDARGMEKRPGCDLGAALRDRCFAANRELRARLDAFRPDLVYHLRRR